MSLKWCFDWHAKLPSQVPKSNKNRSVSSLIIDQDTRIHLKKQTVISPKSKAKDIRTNPDCRYSPYCHRTGTGSLHSSNWYGPSRQHLLFVVFSTRSISLVMSKYPKSSMADSSAFLPQWQTCFQGAKGGKPLSSKTATSTLFSSLVTPAELLRACLMETLTLNIPAGIAKEKHTFKDFTRNFPVIISVVKLLLSPLAILVGISPAISAVNNAWISPETWYSYWQFSWDYFGSSIRNLCSYDWLNSKKNS